MTAPLLLLLAAISTGAAPGPDAGAGDAGALAPPATAPPAAMKEDLEQLADAGIYPVASSVLCARPALLPDGRWDRCPRGEVLEELGWHLTPRSMHHLGVAWAEMANALAAAKLSLERAQQEPDAAGTGNTFLWGVAVGFVGTLAVGIAAVWGVLRLEGR